MIEDDDAVNETVDRAADELYGLDPDQFVTARDQVANELRGRRETAAAKAVKALRRPTIAAGAVNRLVRADPVLLDEFLAATRDLDHTHRAALAGQQGDVRGIGERRQRLLDELVKRATAMLEAEGRASSPHQDDIVRTLQASSDPDLAKRLREGQLVTALEPVSTFDGLTAWFVESGAMTSAAGREQQREQEQANRRAEEALAEAERAVRDAEADVDRSRDELRVAERHLAQVARERDERRVALDRTRSNTDDRQG